MYQKMKIAGIWLALALADQISFNRLSNNVRNHVNSQFSQTKISNVGIKLKLVAFMLDKGNSTSARELLNQFQTEKQSQKLKNRLEHYLKYQ